MALRLLHVNASTCPTIVQGWTALNTLPAPFFPPSSRRSGAEGSLTGLPGGATDKGETGQGAFAALLEPLIRGATNAAAESEKTGNLLEMSGDSQAAEQTSATIAADASREVQWIPHPANSEKGVRSSTGSTSASVPGQGGEEGEPDTDSELPALLQDGQGDESGCFCPVTGPWWFQLNYAPVVPVPAPEAPQSTELPSTQAATAVEAEPESLDNLSAKTSVSANITSTSLQTATQSSVSSLEANPEIDGLPVLPTAKGQTALPQRSQQTFGSGMALPPAEADPAPMAPGLAMKPDEKPLKPEPKPSVSSVKTTDSGLTSQSSANETGAAKPGSPDGSAMKPDGYPATLPTQSFRSGQVQLRPLGGKREDRITGGSAASVVNQPSPFAAARNTEVELPGEAVQPASLNGQQAQVPVRGGNASSDARDRSAEAGGTLRSARTAELSRESAGLNAMDTSALESTYFENPESSFDLIVDSEHSGRGEDAADSMAEGVPSGWETSGSSSAAEQGLNQGGVSAVAIPASESRGATDSGLTTPGTWSTTHTAHSVATQLTKPLEAGADGWVTIQLNPADLGPLRIRFQRDEGNFSAEILATDPDSLRWLELNQADLLESLAGQGVELDELRMGKDPDSGSSWNGPSEQDLDRQPRRPFREDEELLAGANRTGTSAWPPAVKAVSQSYTTTSSLDLIV